MRRPNYHPQIVLMFTPALLHETMRTLSGGSTAGAFAYRPRLEVLVFEAPLLAVEAVVRHVLLHHLIAGVKEHVAGGARSRVFDIIYYKT